LPKRSHVARNSINNLLFHQLQPSFGQSETAEVDLPSPGDDETPEYVGEMPKEEIWEEAEVMELAAEGLGVDEEERAKGAVWMMLARGLADWEERKKAEKAESSHPNRPTFYSKNSAKTLEKKRKAGDMETKIDPRILVSVLLERLKVY
jgi:hypothetical protein